MNKILVVIGSLLLLFFLFGCTETSNFVLPYTTSQFIVQSTDLNYSNFKSSSYDSLCLKIDGNKVTAGPCDVLSENYYLSDDESDVIGYDYLHAYPHDNSTSDYLVFGAGDGLTLIDEYITDFNNPGTSFIPAGQYVFNTYLSLDSGVGSTYVDINVYKYASDGTITSFFGVTTQEVSASVTPLLYTNSYNLIEGQDINSTDRFIVRYYAKTTSVPDVNIGLHYGNSSEYTNIITSVPVGGGSGYVRYLGNTNNLDMGDYNVLADWLIANNVQADYFNSHTIEELLLDTNIWTEGYTNNSLIDWTNASENLETDGNITTDGGAIVIDKATGEEGLAIDSSFNGYPRFRVTHAGSILSGVGSHVFDEPAVPMHFVISSGGLPGLGSQVGLFQNNSLATSNSIFSVLSGTSGISGIQLGDTSAINRGLLYYYNSDDRIYIGDQGSVTSGMSLKAGKLGLNTAYPYGKLDVATGSGYAFIIGANDNTSTRTANSNKYSRFGSIHYSQGDTGTGTPFTIFVGQSLSSRNIMYFGGGTSLGYSASDIWFYTAPGGSTTTGTKQIAIENDGNLHLVNDNQNLVFGADKNAVIRYDGTNLVIDPDVTGTDTGLVYIDGNISATDLIDRTSVYDTTKGNALNYVKDSSQLENNGEIDHSQFYGYTAIETTDFDKPVLVLKDINECTPKDINVCKQETDIEGKVVEVCEISQTEECSTVKKYVKTYPYKKIVEGVSISKEMALLRQQVYDLKTENDLIKNELCKTNPTYMWCK